MAESDRRHKYVYNRVLIDAGRILDPQFDDAVLFFSGAQIEMLRNVTQYLNRRDTYSSEEFLDYYLSPTVADYDTILAIVADMEEVVMGNNNIIFGYSDTLHERVYEDSDVNDRYWVDGAVCPAGEVWRVLGLSVSRDTSCPEWTTPMAYLDSETIRLGGTLLQYNYVAYRVPVDVVLNEGDRISVSFQAAVIGEECGIEYWGYKMVVPT